MGRFLMYATLALLALFVLSATFVFKHGGGDTVAVSDVTVQELASIPRSYDGQTITTEGTLDFSTVQKRYQLRDESAVAIVIRQYSGTDDLNSLRGRSVSVTGRFGFDDKNGPYIDADVIRLRQ